MDLVAETKQIIDDYLEGHRTRSLATLARTSGVSYTTLRRIWQKEGSPSPAPVLKLIDVALKGEARASFLKRHFPEIARSVVDLTGAATPTLPEGRTAALKNFFGRDPHCLVILLALNTIGTTADTIRRLWGEAGAFALDELVESGILTLDTSTGAIGHDLGNGQSFDADMILNFVRISLSHFDQSLLGTPAAKLCHASGAVSAKGLERIHEIASEAIGRIVAIKEDPGYAGPIPFFYDVLMNVYDRSSLSSVDVKEPNHELQ